MRPISEIYLSVIDLAWRLNFSADWVRDRLAAGDFGTGVVKIGGVIRIPLTGVQVFLDRHRVFSRDNFPESVHDGLLEVHVSPKQIGYLMNLSETTIRRKIQSAMFGHLVVNLDGDLRVPQSAVNGFLAAHRFVESPGIKARTIGELRRKAAAAESESPADVIEEVGK